MSGRTGAPEQARTVLACPFSGAIGSRVCGCRQSVKSGISGAARIGCSLEAAQCDCVALINNIRKHAHFTLGQPRPAGALSRRAALQLQCGGLLGGAEPMQRRVGDVHALVQRARKRYAGLTALPFEQIVRAVAAYRGGAGRGRPTGKTRGHGGP